MTASAKRLIGQDPETGAIVLCAVRYAIGRRTYMPSLVADWCKRHWQEIPEKDRKLIQRDIQEEIDRSDRGIGSLGDDCDERTWRSLAAWIQDQSKRTSEVDCKHEPSEPGKFSLDAIRELRKQWGTAERSHPTEPQPKPKEV